MIPTRMKMRRYDIVFAILLLIVSVLFAWLVELKIDGGRWLWPLLASAVWAGMLAVFAVSVSRKDLTRWVAFLAFFPSLIFAFSLLHFLIVIIAGGIGSHAMLRTRHTMFNARKMRLGPALQLNLGALVVAVSLLITSQYYASISQRPIESLLPQLSSVYGVDKTIAHFVGGEAATVDDFIVKTLGSEHILKEGERSQGATADVADGFAQKIFKDFGLDPAALGGAVPAGLPDINQIVAGQQESFENAAIASLRDRLGASTGQELTGSEKMVEVFQNMLDARMQAVVAQNEIIIKTIAEVMAVLVLLTLISLGSLWKYVWMICAQMIFGILRSNRVIRITTVKRDVETLLF